MDDIMKEKEKDITNIDRPNAKIRDVVNYMIDNYDMTISTLKRMDVPWMRDSFGQYVKKEDLDKLGMSGWKKRYVLVVK